MMDGPFKVETPLGTGRSYVLNGNAERIHTFDCTADAESFCEHMNEAYHVGITDSQKKSEWTAEFPNEEGYYWVFDSRNVTEFNPGPYLMRVKGAGEKQWIEYIGTAAVTTHEDIEDFKSRDLLFARVHHPQLPS